MTDTVKVLGQSNPAATTLTTLYTVPESTSTTVSTINVCNQADTAATFNLSVAVAGASDTAEQYLYYELSLPGNSTFQSTLGMTLAATDVVRCYASTANLSFNLFGVEIT